MEIATIIRCEISSLRQELASDLAESLTFARTIWAWRFQLRSIPLADFLRYSSITLHVPVEAADNRHIVWCLACHLACFCPRTRVSVLVHTEAAFGSAPLLNSQRQSA